MLDELARIRHHRLIQKLRLGVLHQFLAEKNVLQTLHLGKSSQAREQGAADEHRLVAEDDVRPPAADIVHQGYEPQSEAPSRESVAEPARRHFLRKRADAREPILREQGVRMQKQQPFAPCSCRTGIHLRCASFGRVQELHTGMALANAPGSVTAAAVDENHLFVAWLGKQALQGLRQGAFFVIGRDDDRDHTVRVLRIVLNWGRSISFAIGSSHGEEKMTISIGDKIPSTVMNQMTSDGPASLSSDELFSGKKVVLFALPGAFTPTCSASHLPGFVANADKIKAKGVDTIACLSVNDAWVMDAWGKSQNAEEIQMVADGSANFTQAVGLELDRTAAGMGLRSQRYAMIVENGVVTELAVEEPGKIEKSSAEAMLALL